MKIFRVALACIVLALFYVAPALADTRITWYYGEQLPSSNLNAQERAERIASGAIMAAIFGNTNGYANLTITPATGATGLFVTINPSTTNGVGSIYQVTADDATSWGGGPLGPTTALPADTTQIPTQAIFGTASSPIGPLAVPTTSGQSQDSLVECQLSTTDTAQTDLSFVTSLGSQESQLLPDNRDDTSMCQAKAGVPSSTPVVPAVDAGWVPIGYVTVPYGATATTVGMISMNPPITAIKSVAAGANITITGTTTPIVGVNPNLIISSISASSLTSTGALNLTGSNGSYSAISLNGAQGESPAQFTAGSTYLGAIDALGSYNLATGSKYGTNATVVGTTTLGTNQQGAGASSALNLDGDATIERGTQNAGALFFGTGSAYEFWTGSTFQFNQSITSTSSVDANGPIGTSSNVTAGGSVSSTGPVYAGGGLNAFGSYNVPFDASTSNQPTEHFEHGTIVGVGGGGGVYNITFDKAYNATPTCVLTPTSDGGTNPTTGTLLISAFLTNGTYYGMTATNNMNATVNINYYCIGY